MTYTGGTELGLTYNNRLKVASMGLQKSDTSYLMNKSYEYYKDGKLKFLDDAVDARFDRQNKYGHHGKIIEALSGGEARGETVPEWARSTSLPYRQTYEFNAFGQMTASTNMHWGKHRGKAYHSIRKRILKTTESKSPVGNLTRTAGILKRFRIAVTSP